MSLQHTADGAGVPAGSTDTSLWTHYAAGERQYCGHSFPDGLRKNARLHNNMVTPTTKSAEHDVPISAEEIVAQGLMSQAEWDKVRALDCEGTGYVGGYFSWV